MYGLGKKLDEKVDKKMNRIIRNLAKREVKISDLELRIKGTLA